MNKSFNLSFFHSFSIIAACLALLSACQRLKEQLIRLNQVGYAPLQ